MADDAPQGTPAGIALGLIGFLAVISIGWFLFGGANRADLRGYFLTPPSAPQIIVPTNGGSGIIQGSTTTVPADPEGLSPEQTPQ
ncbi:hypothetical protein KW798_03980 [Candidatus Parcubacteria bacterium]|nr:hypothetical protein [Candidatus Parcubacteria bacterium]